MKLFKFVENRYTTCEKNQYKILVRASMVIIWLKWWNRKWRIVQAYAKVLLNLKLLFFFLFKIIHKKSVEISPIFLLLFCRFIFRVAEAYYKYYMCEALAILYMFIKFNECRGYSSKYKNTEFSKETICFRFEMEYSLTSIIFFFFFEFHQTVKRCLILERVAISL